MASTELASTGINEIIDAEEGTKQFVTMIVDGQLFGVPVLAVEDVLRAQPITPIPLSGSEILGSINLRGRIVTVISMRSRLGLEDYQDIDNCMHIVVEYKNEQYSFVVDKVGDVLNLSLNDFEQNPANLPSTWQEVALGVYRLEDQIMVVLDIKSMLKFSD